jgi:nicotinamidase/pyrazinamidase
MKSALIIIDVQNDFLPGGALPVPGGDQILPLMNQLLDFPFDLVVASKDWHPPEHCSFARTHPDKKAGELIQLGTVDQILWPVHCVQHSYGSEFSKAWHSEKVHAIFYKGIDPAIDSYSAFFDNQRLKSTGLGEFLKSRQISCLYVAGLATDYCVKYSVLDALGLGFKVDLIEDACRGIHAKSTAEAIQQMKSAGAAITTACAVINKMRSAT